MEEIDNETIIENDVRLSITLDYKEDGTTHTYISVHIAPPFDHQLTPSEQNTNIKAFLINSDVKRPGDFDGEIIKDVHTLIKKLLKRPY
jgi:hypothetical protein